MLPHVNADRLTATCALTIHLALSTGRFARAIPAKLGKQTVPIFKGMLRGAFQSLKGERKS
jgi:hypothetical protein